MLGSINTVFAVSLRMIKKIKAPVYKQRLYVYLIIIYDLK